MTEDKIEPKQIDLICNKIIGIDIEPEDRDVGIFGNEFNIGFECLDEKAEKKNVWISLGDEQFNTLLDLVKPHLDSREAERLYCEEEDKEYKEQEAEGKGK